MSEQVYIKKCKYYDDTVEIGLGQFGSGIYLKFTGEGGWEGVFYRSSPVSNPAVVKVLDVFDKFSGTFNQFCNLLKLTFGNDPDYKLENFD